MRWHQPINIVDYLISDIRKAKISLRRAEHVVLHLVNTTHLQLVHPVELWVMISPASFPGNNSVLQLDTRSRKLFLKRCSPAALHLIPELLRPGTRVNILSRQLHILNYADAFTARELQHRQQRSSPLVAHPLNIPETCVMRSSTHCAT